jgi:hypothetical protein
MAAHPPAVFWYFNAPTRIHRVYQNKFDTLDPACLGQYQVQVVLLCSESCSIARWAALEEPVTMSYRTAYSAK